MSQADSLLRTVDKLLTRFNATDRTAYKRVITKTGGDALLGRPASVMYKDTALDPPPAVRLISGRDLAFAAVGSALLQVGDYIVTLSPHALSLAELQSPNLVLVLKSGTAEEELQIIDFDPAVLNGIDVLFEVVARSKKR